MSGVARAIAPKFVSKIWGSKHLEPWFRNPREPIGEVWFPAGDLLIKFLFTTENLSVQVHPKDDYAARHEKSKGKTEMWYVLRADPDAKVALGFQEPMEREHFRSVAESGKIIDHLAWMSAQPGDTFLTPAGTVHAIGGGLALCEIQQNSDVTYRVFDYGRPRELHLDKAMDVSDLTRHPGPISPRGELLAETDYFITEKLEMSLPRELTEGGFAIILEGIGTIDGQPFVPGTVWELSKTCSRIVPDGPATILTTRVPA
jgi:mannose-6-phosphate isomerase